MVAICMRRPVPVTIVKLLCSFAVHWWATWTEMSHVDQTANLLVNSLYSVGLHVVESGIEIRQKHMKTSIPSELHCIFLVWNTGSYRYWYFATCSSLTQLRICRSVQTGQRHIKGIYWRGPSRLTTQLLVFSCATLKFASAVLSKRLCVCLSQVRVLLKRWNESSWFLARELPLPWVTDPLTYKENKNLSLSL